MKKNILTPLSGTTTFGKDAVTRLAIRHKIDSGGYLEIQGKLQREPENEYDRYAVAVYVEGEKIGYLPSGIADTIKLGSGVAELVIIQLFTELLPKGLRSEAWCWIGDNTPHWEWSEAKRPPMSPQKKAIAKHQATEQMIQNAVQEGGVRAEEFRSGAINGIHYLETVEPIKQLKREGRLEEALQLCLTAIKGAENDAARIGREPAPWYTEQAAIILRKLKRSEEEKEILNRWINHCPSEYTQCHPENAIAKRLEQLLENENQ